MDNLQTHRSPEEGFLPSLWKQALNFFFPPVCFACEDKLGNNDDVFCTYCRQALAYIPDRICRLCGAPVKEELFGEEKCPECPPGTLYFDRALSPLYYYGPIIPAVHALKFRRRREMAHLFARMIFHYLQKRVNKITCDVIVPVPLHPLRWLKRGFNQSEVMAEEISRLGGYPIYSRAIRRIRSTKPQTRLRSTHRSENVEGAFAPGKNEDISGRNVILLDDVFTTGSTINACAKALKEGGAEKVFAVTLCRALSPENL